MYVLRYMNSAICIPLYVFHYMYSATVYVFRNMYSGIHRKNKGKPVTLFALFNPLVPRRHISTG